MALEIRRDDLTDPPLIALVREHYAEMHRVSPPGSCHVLDLDGLRRPDVTFWSAWEGATLAGCGALKELDPRHAEIKSMRTAATHLRRGVGAQVLEHLLGVARQRGYRRLSLETGSQPHFDPARRLYERYGFVVCGPFEGYVEDPASIFMTREL